MSLIVNCAIPKEFIDIVNIIDFSKISVQEQHKHLKMLAGYAEKFVPKLAKPFQPSTTPCSYGIHKGVPQLVFDYLNQYDYARATKEARKMLHDFFPTMIVVVKSTVPTR
jgi:hypothetical protein